jgi:hypothetical protein
VLQISFERLAANTMFDYAGRKNHAVSQSGREVSDYKVFRQIIAQFVESAHGFYNLATRGQRGPKSEIHLTD